MNLARKIGWTAIIIVCAGSVFVVAVNPELRYNWPWILSMCLISGGLLWFNYRRQFSIFDAGEEVVYTFIFALFVPMLIWARISG